MKLIRNLNSCKQYINASAVTIGNFDGLHLGHQALLAELKQQAQQWQVPSVVLLFEPQPKEYFAKRQTVPRLMRFVEKWLALNQLNIDFCFCLRFDKWLAELSAEEFVKTILHDSLNAKAVVVGDDFQFGAKRAGDFSLLQSLTQTYGFEAAQIPSVLIDGYRVSSTLVREALTDGDLVQVNKLLGRPYSLYGKVCYGDQRGRDLGFPTANINLHRHCVPMTGVYAVQVHGVNEKPINGVANVGVRPTFDGSRVLLEVHLFDFSADIYGHNLQVEFLHKLRDEKRYDSFKELVAQIHRDVAEARQFFINHIKQA